MSLNGKVAIITGSGRGIGLAIACKLASDGAGIILNDISQSADLESAVAEISALGVPCQAMVADVSRAEGAEALIKVATDTFGRIDILVNNAGITRDQLLMRMSEADWDTVIAVDLKSVYLCTKAAIRPMMKQRWGRIISMASIVGVMGNVGQGNYAAAKAGIIGFTKSIAKEVASRGITVNAVAPGFIETAMTAGLPEEYKTELKKRIASGVLGQPEDVAAAAAFFASEGAKYITGQVIGVDGGMAGI
ncbi:3-oxoacyl-[acyl-carrier-protein] reductase [Chloroflexota bacterium]